MYFSRNSFLSEKLFYSLLLEVPTGCDEIFKYLKNSLREVRAKCTIILSRANVYLAVAVLKTTSNFF